MKRPTAIRSFGLLALRAGPFGFWVWSCRCPAWQGIGGHPAPQSVALYEARRA